jgi:hypothetical protein
MHVSLNLAVGETVGGRRACPPMASILDTAVVVAAHLTVRATLWSWALAWIVFPIALVAESKARATENTSLGERAGVGREALHLPMLPPLSRPGPLIVVRQGSGGADGQDTPRRLNESC